MDKLSYALGIGIGQQLAQMGAKDLNADDFAQAIKDVIAGVELKVNNQEAQSLVQQFFAEQEERQRAAMAEAGKASRKAGEDFLAENAKKENIVTLPSGLQYEVLVEGNGKKPRLLTRCAATMRDDSSTVRSLTAATTAKSRQCSVSIR